jgi:5-methyltetrahydrofolate--homocysteine methyltransferase
MSQENAALCHPLVALLQERIVIIDGAMGTTIQQYQLTEEQFRGGQGSEGK